MSTFWLTGRRLSRNINQESHTNSRSSSPASFSEKEADGGDGDVTRHRTFKDLKTTMTVTGTTDVNLAASDSCKK